MAAELPESMTAVGKAILKAGGKERNPERPRKKRLNRRKAINGEKKKKGTSALRAAVRRKECDDAVCRPGHTMASEKRGKGSGSKGEEKEEKEIMQTGGCRRPRHRYTEPLVMKRKVDFNQELMPS
jgi:hypothetical protein